MKGSLLLFTILLLNAYTSVRCQKLVAFTVSSGYNDVSVRQMESAKSSNVDLRLMESDGVTTQVNKMAAFRDYLEQLKEERETIVIFVESGSLFLNSSEEIVKRFKLMNASIVLAAEDICRPDPSMNASYPEVANNEKRFIGVNGVIGYPSVLLDALNVNDLIKIEDSQYYFAKLFTNVDLREKFHVKLDSKSEIFQTLEHSYDEVSVEHTGDGEGYLYNARTKTLPAVVQPGKMMIQLQSLTNYLGRTWDPIRGCQHCSLNRIDLNNSDTTNYPSVTIAVFIDTPTPFLNEFFFKLSQLSYPKTRTNLLVSNMIISHENAVRGFLDTHMEQYATIEYVDSSLNSTSALRRMQAMNMAQTNSEYILVLDSLVHLTTSTAIESLISYNKSIVAPLVSRRGQLWSNFWGDVNSEGYYKRSSDYLEIVTREKIGVWQVPHISNIYLIKTSLLVTVPNPLSPLPKYEQTDNEMLFTSNLRNSAVSMWVANEQKYGYIVNAETTTTEHLHNDMWEIFANPIDWREKYIHPEYETLVQIDFLLKNFTQPCPDVFWWPFLSETFAKHLIEEMEYFGEWSDGNNKDARLEGGYEAVPTRDIHMRQINWEQHWMKALKTYVYPIQIKLFQGYSEEPRARMNFVVRYKPTEQDRLRPHHDASSYTLNIALNKPGIDYEGGGAKFNRYNAK